MNAAVIAKAPAAVEIIELGGRCFEVPPLPLGRLRKLMSSFNRIGLAMNTGGMSDEVLGDMVAVLSVGLGMTCEELDELPTNVVELTAAFEGLMRVSGFDQQIRARLADMRGDATGGLAAAAAAGF